MVSDAGTRFIGVLQLWEIKEVHARGHAKSSAGLRNFSVPQVHAEFSGIFSGSLFDGRLVC